MSDAGAGPAPGARRPASGSSRLRDSLLVRVALLLTLALLPVGVVIVAQTWQAANRSGEISANTLLAQTSALVAPERDAINTAIGVAKTLADALATLEPDGAACYALFERAGRSNPRLAHILFIEDDLTTRCNTTGEFHDMSGNVRAQKLLEAGAPTILFNARGAISDQPVIILSEPVGRADDGGLRGAVALSIPVAGIGFQKDTTALARSATVVTFSADGEVLTSVGPEGAVADSLPADIELADLVGLPASTFEAVTPTGEERVFAVVPIVAGRAYALGSWSPGTSATGGVGFVGSTLGFPLLIWVVTMIVALVALNQLVLRHVNTLGLRMRSFADIRRIYRPAEISSAPTELRDIDDAFERMATQIIRDEADLENAVREREVLLKEVHHRVKNNLQLMSSIINMQLRKVSSVEARQALRQFQDRVASLASVHQALYQEPSLTRLQVDVLIDDILTQLAALGSADRRGVEVTRALDPVTLLPDQAGPLAMLTTEAIVNAFKYGGPDDGGRFEIRQTLKTTGKGDDARITMTIENSVPPDPAANDGSGLGRQLIAAFASQLDAQLEEESRADRFILRVTFKPAPFEPA